MIDCNNCHHYLSDIEVLICKYTENLCIVCMPDEQAEQLDSVLQEDDKGE